MRSPREPFGERPEQPGQPEPSEITEVFRQPGLLLDPPPGAYAEVRRRAVARRRRRVLAVGVAAALCVGGTAVMAAVTGPEEETTAVPPVTETPSTTDAPETDSPEPEPSAPPSDSPEDSAPESQQQPSSPATGGEQTREPEEPTASPPPEQEPARMTDCQSEALGLGIASTNGAAGSVIFTLELTNTGDDPCALVGYPGVSLVGGDDGEQIGAAAQRGQERGVGERVELAPGESARADVRLARAENYPVEECEPRDARGLRVYPPGEYDALFLPHEGLTGCVNEDVRLLFVTVVYQ